MSDVNNNCLLSGSNLKVSFFFDFLSYLLISTKLTLYTPRDSIYDSLVLNYFTINSNSSIRYCYFVGRLLLTNPFPCVTSWDGDRSSVYIPHTSVWLGYLLFLFSCIIFSYCHTITPLVHYFYEIPLIITLSYFLI